MKKSMGLFLFFAVILLNRVNAQTITFEDLGLGADTYSGDHAFNSGGAGFNNFYSTAFGDPYTAGWSYSSKLDITMPGYSNQFSAYNLPAGGGAGGSNTYGIAFNDSFVIPKITLPSGTRPVSMQVTNTTYTALAIINGDGFSADLAPFGGVSGNDSDYLKLIITGLNDADQPIGNIDYYLADYRFSDNSQDYYIKNWQTVDLSSLVGAAKLTFGFEGTKTNDFGLTTPTYLAADNLIVTAVPEPSSIALIAIAGMCTLFVKLRRRQNGC